MNIPAKPFRHKGKKIKQIRFKSSKVQSKNNEHGYFISDPTRQFTCRCARNSPAYPESSRGAQKQDAGIKQIMLAKSHCPTRGNRHFERLQIPVRSNASSQPTGS
jgi:hypothetical protein